MTFVTPMEIQRERDEADILPREIVVDQVAADGVIPAESVQILDDHAVDKTALDIRFQPREARSVEVRAGEAVVNIDVNQRHFGVLPQEFEQDLPLVGDGNGLVFLLQILFGESDVKGSPPSLERLLRLPRVVSIFFNHI